MAGEENNSIKGDRALRAGDDDKLGFRDVAARIAIALVDRASEDGLVVGLEGAWGSGKSSLLYLIEDELAKLPPERRPSVINFRPWLVGNRDALISSLFGELSLQLDQVALAAGDATGVTVAKAKEAGEALRSFMHGLERVGAVLEFAGEASGVGLLKLAGQGAKAMGEAAADKMDNAPLSELKDKLVKALSDLGHRFIITIDDVDRLEPAEVIEVLRLVRSVVDLPNVVYLLCYDSGILAHSIQTAAGVEDGHAYLEKIVQLTVMVPRPEELQLRQWFTDALHEIASAKNDDELSRLKSVIDYEGGRQLGTPRAVVRALDAIRFFWPPLRDAGADLADLVWLQLIKDGNPKLYRWIEEYCAVVAVVSLGIARVETAESTRLLLKLMASVPNYHFDDVTYRYNFAEQLPALEIDHGKDGHSFKLFERFDGRKRDDAIAKKRLASPDHYRLYFALAGPSHAVTQSDFDTVLASADAGPTKLGAALLSLHDQGVAGTLSKADILLERIKGGRADTLSPTQCENLLVTFSQVMDDAFRRHPFDPGWFNSIWDRAGDLIPVLASKLDPATRPALIETMFGAGAAIDWLTDIFRRECHSHGRVPGQSRRPDKQLFADGEIDQITGLMIGRYQRMSATEILATSRPLSLLYAWFQGGDKDGARAFVAATTASDEGLITTLGSFIATIHSSDRGAYKVLRKTDLETFLDVDAVVGRLQALLGDKALGRRAKRLDDAFRGGTSF